MRNSTQSGFTLVKPKRSEVPAKAGIHRQAFTLVELSIVLVVIGLIVGGIMAGQSLVRLSALRSTMNDLTDYASAVGKFRNEFRSLPGDLSTATSYWGFAAGATGTDVTCYNASQANGTATCNGDGDTSLDLTNPASGVSDATELYLAWKHLINAGVITGPSLTGRTANSGAYGTVAGTNTPRGKIDDLAYLLSSHIGCLTGADATYYAGCYPLVIQFGKSNSTGLAPAAHITPEEMYSMDKKMDDALPGLGQLRAYESDSTCASSDTAYVLTGTGFVCRGIFGIDPITANQ